MEMKGHGILLLVEESDGCLYRILPDMRFLDAAHIVREMSYFPTFQGAHRELLGKVAIVGYKSESRRTEHPLPLIVYSIGSLAPFTRYVHCQLAIRRFYGIVACLCSESAKQ